MAISPFSLEHEWTLNWTTVPEPMKPARYINRESPKERQALVALACIGAIGGLQLTRLFGLDKKRKKRMTAEKKIIRHEVQKNKQIIPVYTLGINGAGMIECPGYKTNYWQNYTKEELLKRLLFFQLYGYFSGAKIFPAPDPFTGVIFYKNKPLYIYVSRQDIQPLLLFLKWRNDFGERIIILTESLTHLQSFLLSSSCKVRAVTDQDLKSNELRKLFYIQKESGLWVKE